MMILVLKVILTILVISLGALVIWCFSGNDMELRNWLRLIVVLSTIIMVALDIKILWFM